MKNRCFRTLICMVLSAVLLMGCAYASEFPFDTQQKGADGEFATLGLTPEFDYEVPVSLPSILVDQVGYDPESKKIAVFQGELLPDTFTVTDADSGEAVYTAKIAQKGYNKKENTFISYGDFTAF